MKLIIFSGNVMHTERPSGDKSSKFVERPERKRTGKLEGGQEVNSNPKVSKVLINVPQWILQNPQTGLMARLSAARTNQEVGAARGFFTVIYYAIAMAAGWKLPSTAEGGVELKEMPKKTFQGREKTNKQQITKLEEQFNNLKPKEYNAFLKKVLNLKEKQPSERLGRLEQRVAEKILGMKEELRNMDLLTLSDKDLLSHHQNIENEISRLESREIGHEDGDIFIQSALEETREKGINILNGLKKEIQNEFENRAIEARKELEEAIPKELKEAKNRLELLQNQLPSLERIDKNEHSKMVQLQGELDRLEQRQKNVPNEIDRLQEDLLRIRENKIDNKIKQWDEQIKQSEEFIKSKKKEFDLNSKSADQLRFNELKEKKSRLEKTGKSEGWFGILDAKETKEFEKLTNKMLPWQQIEDAQNTIKMSEEEKIKQVTELYQEHLAPLELKIKNLENEKGGLSEKIKLQKSTYNAAVSESEAAQENYRNAKNEIPLLEKTLSQGKEKVKGKLKNYAQAIASREGLKIKEWDPNKRPYSTQIVDAVREGLKEFPFLEIDPKTLLQ